jgi:hypothetical protein
MLVLPFGRPAGLRVAWIPWEVVGDAVRAVAGWLEPCAMGTTVIDFSVSCQCTVLMNWFAYLVQPNFLC